MSGNNITDGNMKVIKKILTNGWVIGIVARERKILMSRSTLQKLASSI
jgi:hypothetical protein